MPENVKRALPPNSSDDTCFDLDNRLERASTVYIGIPEFPLYHMTNDISSSIHIEVLHGSETAPPTVAWYSLTPKFNYKLI